VLYNMKMMVTVQSQIGKYFVFPRCGGIPQMDLQKHMYARECKHPSHRYVSESPFASEQLQRMNL
jgi:hypothetical protein